MVRVVLAFGVVTWHAVALTYGRQPDDYGAKPYWIGVYSILPMFFALSGFLVASSALRLPLREYIANRVVRIVPALGVDILLSAIILGPIFTLEPLQSYFADSKFWHYFLNIIGRIHYQLPGVFLSNPYPDVVNGSLWTVPYEIMCYVVMSLLILFGLIRRSTWPVGITIAFLSIAILIDFSGFVTNVRVVDKFIHFTFINQGTKLTAFFLAGAAFYVGRNRIFFDGRIALAIVGAALLVGIFGFPDWGHSTLLDLMAVFPLSYVVVWCGLASLPKLPLFRHGDYSYGIYLYHFPILQALVSLFHFSAWWMLEGAALIPVTAMAMFSWHFIERPILKQRRRFSVVGSRIAAESMRKTEPESPGTQPLQTQNRRAVLDRLGG